MIDKNFSPTVTLNPKASLKLLAAELMLIARDVDVMAAIRRSWVLSVVTPAAIAWTFPFVGKMNATAERTIDAPFPMIIRTKTAMIMTLAESMNDFVDFPMSGTLLKAGTVTLVVPMIREPDTLLVRFEMSGETVVSFMTYATAV